MWQAGMRQSAGTVIQAMMTAQVVVAVVLLVVIVVVIVATAFRVCFQFHFVHFRQAEIRVNLPACPMGRKRERERASTHRE